MKKNRVSAVIQGDSEAIIDKGEVQAKIDRLSTYMHRVRTRIKRLDKQLENRLANDLEQGVLERGLRSFGLRSAHERVL